MKKLSLLLAMLLGTGMLFAADDASPKRANRSGERGQMRQRAPEDPAKAFNLNETEKTAYEKVTADRKTLETAYREAKAKLDAEYRPQFEKSFDAETAVLKTAADRQDNKRLNRTLQRREDGKDRMVMMMIFRAGMPEGMTGPGMGGMGGNRGNRPQPPPQRD